MAKRGKGRPQFEPTKAQRERVAVLAGAGWRHEDLAIGLSIDPDTLRKHFQKELTFGAFERRAEVTEAIYREAKKGRTAAQKLYLAMEPEAEAPPMQPMPAEVGAAVAGAVAAVPEAQPEGKKAQAQAAASTAAAGTHWQGLLDEEPPTTTRQ